MQTKNRTLIREVIDEFKREQLLKDEYLSPYQKTEKLISSYNLLKSAVERKKLSMEEIELNGLTPNNATIKERVQGGNTEYKSEIEKKEERMEELKNDIEYFERVICLIEQAMETVKQDKYYKILEMKYFNKNTMEDIAEEFEVDVRTIKRNKNRLINEMSLVFISTNDIKKLIEI